MNSLASQPLVGILVLNYHHPEETHDAIANLLAREPGSTRIFWIENDSAHTREALNALLARASFPWAYLNPEQDSMPPPGTVGVILCEENLGYAGGNNVGLRYLRAQNVPYAWVLNNDTKVITGSSRELVKAAKARPDVGAWGTLILASHGHFYFGGIVQSRDFSIKLAASPEMLETDPMSYVSGASLFAPLEAMERVGYIPEHYFLYYEDPALCMELRKHGYGASAIWDTVVFHLESLSTGRRSSLMDFYNRRNRWHFIREYFPSHLKRQFLGFLHHMQKYILRCHFRRAWLEVLALIDFHKNRLGRTHRNLACVKHTRKKWFARRNALASPKSSTTLPPLPDDCAPSALPSDQTAQGSRSAASN